MHLSRLDASSSSLGCSATVVRSLLQIHPEILQGDSQLMRSIESMSDLGWRSRIVERCARLRYDDPVGYEATTWRSMVGRAPEGSRIPVPCAWIRPIHPIPRVILAPGIKAIADSRIAASCKKFAIQVDPTRCPVLAPSLPPNSWCTS